MNGAVDRSGTHLEMAARWAAAPAVPGTKACPMARRFAAAMMVTTPRVLMLVFVGERRGEEGRSRLCCVWSLLQYVHTPIMILSHSLSYSYLYDTFLLSYCRKLCGSDGLQLDDEARNLSNMS